MRKILLFTLFLTVSVSSVNLVFGQQIQSNALKQMQSLISEKESRTPAQKKMDSQLWYAIKQERGQSITSEVATLEVNVNKDANGKVLVEIKANITSGLVQAIINGGGQIISKSEIYKVITARIPLQAAEQIAALPDVQFINVAYPARHAGSPIAPDKFKSPTGLINDAGKIPFLADNNLSNGKYRPGFAIRAERIREQVIKALAIQGITPNTPFTGSVTSQGDVTHRAAAGRAAFGINGSGVKIGIISDSYNSLGTASTDVTNGDLPGVGNPNGFTTPVTVLSDITTGSDEGRAMLQIVHDLAPGAKLYFATAFISEPAFAQNILDLRTAGCDIICDDVFYFDEPPFQDGIVAQSVNTVTASGALYFSSAGNQGNKNDNTSSVWEGDFIDGGPLALLPGGTLNNFSGGTLSNAITVNNGDPIYLFWADPQNASANDYDLFILDAGLTTVLASSTTIQNGTQNPRENVASQAAGRRIVIFKKTGSADRALHLNTFGDGITFNTQGQTHGHSSAAAAFSVAATPAATTPFGGPNGPFPGVFNTANKVETFSSDGPRRVFYDANGTPITAGNFLFGTSGGTLRQKPDITAADGVVTTLPGSSGLNPFFGTSAAAPHAASIAALLKSGVAGITPAQIRTALTSTAIDIENAGTDRDAGFGIVMAYEALQFVGATAQAVMAPGTTSLTGESCNPFNNAIDPGETVTVSFCVQNIGAANTANLVGTLLNTGGVSAASGPQTYGVVVAGGSSVCKSFTFTANGTCGGTFTASIQLQDGASNLGTLTFTLSLGVLNTSFTQNFDALTVPALPVGWVTSQPTNLPAAAPWLTSNSGTPTPVAVSAPNSIFSPDPANVLDNIIETPATLITSSVAKLTFQNNFNLESGFDGGVLEISIPSVNAGAYQDIITAGGSFVTGGYTAAISTAFSSPISGRQAWTGSSGSFILTTVNIPASAVGQSIKLRFRMASDVSVGSTGWRIDDIVITNGSLCSSCGACVPPAVTSQPANTAGCTGGTVNFIIAASGSTPLTYQWQENTGSGFNNLTNTGVYSGVTSNVLTITGLISAMNTYQYRCIITNTCGNATTIAAVLTVSNSVVITGQPSDKIICLNGNTTFSVTATGALAYQWQINQGAGFVNLNNNGSFSGVTTSTLAITTAGIIYNGNTFRCVVSNPCGPVNSNSATLTVNNPPTISVSPNGSCSPVVLTASGTSNTYSWSPATGLSSTTGATVTATVGVNTTYTVTGTITASGCTNTATVNVLGSSTAAVLSGPSNICTGSTANLVVTVTGGISPYTVIYSNGTTNTTITGYVSGTPIPVTPATSVTYTLVSVTGANGCAGSGNSGSVVVTSNPAPTISVSPNNQCTTGSGIVLTATGTADTYTWTPAAGLSTTTGAIVTANPVLNTVYTVTGTITATGCTATAIDTVNVTPAAPVVSPASITLCPGSTTLLTVAPTLVTTPNASSLSIPSVGNATPYPSTILVGGLPASGVRVKSVNINGLSHTFSGDIDMLLQSPDGTNVMLMSDVGTSSISNINLVFDDAATSFVPTVPVSGTYRPTNTAGPDNFPAPGPGSVTIVNQPLALFSPGNLNGGWKLYVVDDASGDQGSITSWSITFEINGALWTPVTGLFKDALATIPYVANTVSGATIYAKPGTTTTYTATRASATCTSSSSTSVVTVLVPAAITTQPAAAASVCVGANATITVVASGTSLSYQWQISTNGGTTWTNITGANSATLVLPAVAITATASQYRVIITNSCTTVTSAATTLTVNALPTVTAGSLANRICLSDTLIPLVGTPTGGSWSGIGVSGFNFIPTATSIGTYTLTYSYTGTTGCTATATTTAKVEDCPERIRLLRDNAVILYPNPNNGRFNIRMNSTLYNYLGMRVFNTAGQLIKVQNFGSLVYGRVLSIDLTNLPADVYLVKFYYDDGVRTSAKTFKVVVGGH